MASPQKQDRVYTIEDINNLPEGTIAELIDGQIYMQASPSITHQNLSNEISFVLTSYVKSKKGKCKVFVAPIDVFLSGNENDCFIPDISIICNPEILKERGCYGAPDFIIEITSPSTASRDYLLKSGKYQAAGVREYWIVNPQTKSILVYFFENSVEPNKHTFKDKIKVNIYNDLYIDFNELNI